MTRYEVKYILRYANAAYVRSKRPIFKGSYMAVQIHLWSNVYGVAIVGFCIFQLRRQCSVSASHSGVSSKRQTHQGYLSATPSKTDSIKIIFTLWDYTPLLNSTCRHHCAIDIGVGAYMLQTFIFQSKNTVRINCS